MSFFPGDFAAIKDRFITTTILRDPAKRLISQYFQYRRASRVEIGEHSDAAKSLSLIAYIDWLAHRNSFADLNTACLWLATLTAPGDAPLEGEDAYAFALQALKELDIVGFTSSLDAYAETIRAYFELPPGITPRVNVSSQEELLEISGEAVEAANELVAWDLKLYKTALTLSAPAQNTATFTEKEFAVFPIAFPALDFGRGAVVVRRVQAGVETPVSIESQLACGDTLTIQLDVEASSDGEATVGFGIRNALGDLMFGTNSQLLAQQIRLQKGTSQQITFRLPCLLGPGQYHVHVAVHQGMSHLEGCDHWLEPAAHFSVTSIRGPIFVGAVNFPTSVEVASNKAE